MTDLTFQIKEANTFVCMSKYNKHTENLIREFCFRNLTSWDKVPGEVFGTYKYEIGHVYATFSPDRKEFRINKSFYQSLLEFLSVKGIDINNIDSSIMDEIEPLAVEFKWKEFEATPRSEDQKEYLDFMLREDKRLVVINASTGGGKALTSQTLVLIPNGWKPIGELEVGDEVIAWDGTVTKVTGVFPQGELPINKIVFYDGRKAYACDEHLWKVFDARRGREEGGEWSVVNTKELKRRLTLCQPRLYIPLMKLTEEADKDLPIDPYLFGALLGDGGLSVLNKCSFTNADEFVVNKVLKKLNDIDLTLRCYQLDKKSYDYAIVSKDYGKHDGRKNFFNIINDLKMQVLSIDKKIPDIYLNSSVEQRLELLRGLMDTDGEVAIGGTPVYSTSSKQLALDVQQLAMSLGAIATVSCRIPKYTWKGEKKEGLLAYRINIRHPIPEQIVTLPRRLERLSNDNQYAHKLKLNIRSIKPAGVADCTCISVDHPDKLFIIKDFIVTHNTVVTIMGFVKLGYRVVITILPRYVPIWIEAFNKFLDLKPEDVINISDHDINVIYEAFKEGTVNPKIVFFQLTRIDTYIKRMRESPESIPHLDEFFNVIKGGVRIIDEAHESIYSVYSSLLYGNISKNVALSATLRGDNAFINKIYSGTFPDDAYLKAPIYEKYIKVVNYYHRMNINKHRIRTVSFGGYSHVLYEQSILKKRHIFDGYYKMCREAFITHYLEGKREGQKAMFFFSTVKMCNAFAEALQKDYPELDIFVFTGEISKKKGMAQEYAKHDVVVTTPTSCGTGKDIEKLFIVFAGVSVSSSQRVDQMAGRLRGIDKWWPDLDPIYLTFVCRDIKKQVDYAGKRKQVLSKKAKTFELIDSGFYI